MVGTSRTSGDRLPQTATRWVGGQAASLGTLPGSQFSRAFAENARGQAVGEATAADGSPRAVLFTRDGTVRDLGGLGSGSAVANDINARGTVAGVSSAPGGPTTAVVFGSGGPQALPPLEPQVTGISRADAVNHAGDVVGHASGFFNFPTLDGSAVLWREGSAHNLNALVTDANGFVLRSAEDIDERGRIVGYGTIDGETHAFLLTPQR